MHDLLNPCECGSNCECGAPDSLTSSHSSRTEPKGVSKGLAVLAQAAALLDNALVPKVKVVKAHLSKTKKRTRDGSASPTIRPAELKRSKQISASETPSSSCCSSKKILPSADPEVPPLSFFGSHLLAPVERAPIPAPPYLPPPLPPASTLQAESTASGCCCGFQCNCPGCTEHRGAAYAEPGHSDCASGDCPTCVNNESGLGLESTAPLPIFNFMVSLPKDVPAPSATALNALFARIPQTKLPQSSTRDAHQLQPATPAIGGSCCGGRSSGE